MTKLGEHLLRNVREAREALEKGDVGAFRIHQSPDVKAIRGKLGLTQQGFAKRFSLPLGNVRDWEQSRVTPDRAAQVLLRVIERAPDVVAEVVAPQTPKRTGAKRASSVGAKGASARG